MIRRLGFGVLRGLFAFVLLAAVGAAEGQPPVSGRLETLHGRRLLRVWGTPATMGFAHGFLLHEDIVADFQDQIRVLFATDVAAYDVTLPKVLAAVRIPAESRQEIDAIFAGMLAAHGAPPVLPLLSRPLGVEDLYFYNAMDVIRGLSCSGFTVWGERAGEAGVLSTRNFDYAAFSPSVVSHQLVLVRRPEGRRSVATFTLPGYLGAFTGLNDARIALFLHDGNGPRSARAESPFVPACLVLKELLETSTAENVHRRTQEALADAATPYSYLVRLVTPRTAGGSTSPETVFRIDARGLTQNPSGDTFCITTNHYLDGQGQPLEGTAADSLERYRQLEPVVRRSVTSAAAWEALRSVARSSPRSLTLHSVVYLPERRRLEFAMAEWSGESPLAAPLAEVISVSTDELWAR